MSILVRDVQFHTIEDAQLKLLIGYAEQDIHDFTRQAAALTLLKAIIRRKLVSTDLSEVVTKCEEISIQSYEASIRRQCREVVAAYLMDYPVGDKLRDHLEFYITQLDYEVECGRLSAIDMLKTMINVFPPGTVVVYSGFFFIPLAMRLVNDESAECKKQAQAAIIVLLGKLDSNQRNLLFNMCMTWLQAEKVNSNY